MVNEKTSTPPRRSFFARIWSLLGLVALLQLVGGAVFFLNSERRTSGNRKEKSIHAGSVADFPPGSVTLIGEGHLYLCRLDDGAFLALSRKCTHLGCAVPWVVERKQFECPCHASTFDQYGAVLKSPAPRALDLFPVTFEGDRVMVDVATPIRRSAYNPGQLAYPGKER